MGDCFWRLIVNKALRKGLLWSTGFAGEKPNGDHSVGFKNLFNREFAQKTPLTASTPTLPDLQGAGAVRDLREVASDLDWRAAA